MREGGREGGDRAAVICDCGIRWRDDAPGAVAATRMLRPRSFRRRGYCPHACCDEAAQYQYQRSSIILLTSQYQLRQHRPPHLVLCPWPGHTGGSLVGRCAAAHNTRCGGWCSQMRRLVQRPTKRPPMCRAWDAGGGGARPRAVPAMWCHCHIDIAIQLAGILLYIRCCSTATAARRRGLLPLNSCYGGQGSCMASWARTLTVAARSRAPPEPARTLSRGLIRAMTRIASHD